MAVYSKVAPYGAVIKRASEFVRKLVFSIAVFGPQGVKTTFSTKGNYRSS